MNKISGPMYDWVARHTSEVEHEVIEFRGGTLDLLRVAHEQDIHRAELQTAVKNLLEDRFEDHAAIGDTGECEQGCIRCGHERDAERALRRSAQNSIEAT